MVVVCLQRNLGVRQHPHLLVRILNMRAKMRRLAALTLVAVALGCKSEWHGFVYPDRDNLLTYRDIGVYSTLEDCRAAARAALASANATDRGDYECGKNCRPSGGIHVCDETLR